MNWCKTCYLETEDEVCKICDNKTEQDIPYEIYWCNECKIPIIKEANDIDKETCSLCGNTIKYLSVDLRPVFPEERLLVEILLDKPLEFVEKSVWCHNNRYYIDGKRKLITSKHYKKYTSDYITEKLDEYKKYNTYDYFNSYIERFTLANKVHLNYLVDEAHSFIKNVSAKYPEESIVLSFSGGKDSTVTADLAIRALSNPSLVHIFGDTTLEFPLTMEYAKRYRENNQKAIFKIAKNKDQNFRDVCEDIGPPARMMRWCCSMFKTGPITRVLNSLYNDENILTFYGIRKNESVSRSKYNRIEDDAESIKIQKQTVASPIFLWRDIDI